MHYSALNSEKSANKGSQTEFASKVKINVFSKKFRTERPPEGTCEVKEKIQICKYVEVIVQPLIIHTLCIAQFF